MREKLSKILEKTAGAKVPFDVFVPEHDAHGHYSTNAGLRLGKAAGKDPMAVAGALAEKIKKTAPRGLFDRIEVVKPGFINFWLGQEALADELRKIAKAKDSFGGSFLGKGKTVIVEYSQPNIAKELHVGHLRTTFIGDALANVYETLGYRVVRWNYLGDWGTQFGKVIAAYKLWGEKDRVRKDPIGELSRLYVKFHEEVKKNPVLENRGREEFKKLEEGDKENRKLWEWFRTESLRGLSKIYELLGVRFTTYIGESFFEKAMKPLVGDLLHRGIAKRSEGAVIVPLDEFHLPPALVEKSDGTSLYLSRDLANLKYRISRWHPAKILYVVGSEQTLHFEQVFAVAKILKFPKTELAHVKYGLILGEDAKKLKTREGKTVLAKDVVEKAVRLARGVISEKSPLLPDDEKALIAETVGIGALKYNVLRENHKSDMVFDWDRMLDFAGESGPYLQYTRARLLSIRKKAERIGKGDPSFLTKEEELAVVRHLIRFPEEIEKSGETFLTNNLAKYLYDLATLANRLYETTPVLKEENRDRRNARFLLIDAAARVLGRGLRILGIKAPERI